MFRKNMFLLKNNGLLQKSCLFRPAAVVVHRFSVLQFNFKTAISRNYTETKPNLKVKTSNLCNSCTKSRYNNRVYFENFNFSLNIRYLSQMSSKLSLSDRLLRIRNPEEFSNRVLNRSPKNSRQLSVNNSNQNRANNFFNSTEPDRVNPNINPVSKPVSANRSVKFNNLIIESHCCNEPTPVAQLDRIFAFLSNFLNDKNLIVHPKVKVNRRRKISCTYNLKWPKKLNFTAVGSSAKEASINAAEIALESLRKMGRLTHDGFPICVDNRKFLQSNFSGQKRNYSTSTSEENSKKIVPPPKVREEVLEKEMDQCHKLFPSPKNVLHNAFDTVCRELSDDSLKLQPSFSVIKERKNSNSWCCTYNVKWPTSKKFAVVAKSKQEASNKAALSVLTWLKNNGRITKEGYPVLLDKTEVKELIQNSAQFLALDSNTMDRIKDINVKFESMLLPHILNNRADRENNNTELAPDNFENAKLEQIKLRRNSKPKFLGHPVYYAKEKVQLPIAAYKEEFIQLLQDNRVIIVKGEPGCGKSTRIPQYVLEGWVTSMQSSDELCRIAVTQPRRIAAISLAERVANERDESTGSIVGFQVRLKSNFQPATGRILYCTTGILLRHLQSDPTLSTFSHVILDEAHERDVNTDLLMNLLRYTMKTNPKLKLIVMSATIDTKMFQNYFDNAPIMHIPGFTHPVKPHFLDEVTKLDLSKTQKMCESATPSVVHDDVVKVIKFIHKHHKEGAILCFLPGWEDMSKIQRLLPYSNDMTVLCLHSRLQDSDQWKIFSQPPPGVRKVILATNIAETSVTIDDVVYVIDTGIHKENRFDSEKGVNCIDNYWISQSSMIQRKGRAGRVRPGQSFHLYPKRKFESFPRFTDPEILRTSLTKILLDSKVYSNNMDALKFMSQLPCPPEETTTLRAVKELKDLELLDDDEKLTSLGKVLADFQLEPKLAKVLVNSVVYKCVTPIVDIVTLFSAETEFFQSGLIDKEGVKRVKTRFCGSSDHLALMRIFEKWLEYYEDGDERGAKNFCYDTNLVSHKLQTIQKLRQIHFEYLFKGLHDALAVSDNNSDNDELVKAVLLSGVGTLLQHRNWDFVKGRCKKTNVFLTNNNHKATITPESVNFKKLSLPSEYLIYINETRSNIRRTTLIRESSAISPIAVLLFSNKKLEVKETNEENKMLLSLKDTKVRFVCPKDQVMEIMKCKDALNSVYQYYIFQMTEGGNFDAKINENWDKILSNLNVILTKYAIR